MYNDERGAWVRSWVHTSALTPIVPHAPRGNASQDAPRPLSNVARSIPGGTYAERARSVFRRSVNQRAPKLHELPALPRLIANKPIHTVVQWILS